MDRLCRNWETLTAYCESPIEQTLAWELFHRAAVLSQRVPYVIAPTLERVVKIGYTFEPQRRFGSFRADLAVTLVQQETGTGGNGVYKVDTIPHCFRAQLVIECDGFEYHDRTAEQANRDKKRDRVLLASGWPVIRFMGHEIHADPIGCADQALEILRVLIEEEVRQTETMRRNMRRLRERDQQ